MLRWGYGLPGILTSKLPFGRGCVHRRSYDPLVWASIMLNPYTTHHNTTSLDCGKILSLFAAESAGRALGEWAEAAALCSEPGPGSESAELKGLITRVLLKGLRGWYKVG